MMRRKHTRTTHLYRLEEDPRKRHKFREISCSPPPREDIDARDDVPRVGGHWRSSVDPPQPLPESRFSRFLGSGAALLPDFSRESSEPSTDHTRFPSVLPHQRQSERSERGGAGREAKRRAGPVHLQGQARVHPPLHGEPICPSICSAMSGPLAVHNIQDHHRASLKKDQES